MTRYEIPLHPYETEEKEGLYAIVEYGDVTLIDYTGDPPHDLIRLSRRDALRVVRVLTTWLASETKVYHKFAEEYGEYKEDD